MQFLSSCLTQLLTLSSLLSIFTTAFHPTGVSLNSDLSTRNISIIQSKSSLGRTNTSIRSSTVTRNENTEIERRRTNTVTPPPISPATNLENQIYIWRNHQVRYQVAHPSGTSGSKGNVILIHGLFVNSDHWRYTLKGLSEAGYTAYAIDLLGNGYSSKPNPNDEISKRLVCGESNGRFTSEAEKTKRNVTLGTASGNTRIAKEIDLIHPCQSPYNFFTWSEQVADFTRDVVLKASSSSQAGVGVGAVAEVEKVTVVANSIGTITAFQSILDNPTLYNGAFIVNPNFRELHSAEVPLSDLSMPLIRQVQSLLRSKGQSVFDALAKPDTVKQILMEPYAISEAVDDTLVNVLLTPLLTPGASDVVFDTLSYSAGPLLEQQLREEGFAKVPVWITYGSKDPWTPPARVESLVDIDSVEKVIRLDGVGHCPHDEAPHLVNPLLLEFMDRIKDTTGSSTSTDKKTDDVPYFLR
mmetsp:Transcript_1253/g.1526  ORF Transcript_1253/g.1526 Transcript_1253/m.1526 type:complete len:469 (+) Transcript_1253:83-1489(+)